MNDERKPVWKGNLRIKVIVEALDDETGEKLEEEFYEEHTYILGALEKVCSDDSIYDLVAKRASEIIEDAVANEMMLYYRDGAGRKVIMEAVQERLGMKPEQT